MNIIKMLHTTKGRFIGYTLLVLLNAGIVIGVIHILDKWVAPQNDPWETSQLVGIEIYQDHVVICFREMVGPGIYEDLEYKKSLVWFQNNKDRLVIGRHFNYEALE